MAYPQQPYQPPYPVPVPPPAPPAKRRTSVASKVMFGAGVLMFIVGIALAAGRGDLTQPVAQSSPTPVVVYVTVQPTAAGSTAPAPAKTTPKVTAVAVQIFDGIWTVGVDIPAGRYRVTANVSSDCYWAIYKTGDNSDIIDNDLPGGGRPQVTLKVGQDFKTQDCGTWQKF
jgi:hypothetical protein